MGKELRFLKRLGDALPRYAMAGQPSNLFALEPDVATADPQLPHDEIEQRGLPRSIRSDKRLAYPCLKLQIHPANRSQTAEILCQTAYVQKYHYRSPAWADALAVSQLPVRLERANNTAWKKKHDQDQQQSHQQRITIIPHVFHPLLQ